VTGPPLVAGRVYGLRTWRVAVVDGDERLTGPYQETPWPDEGLPLEVRRPKWPWRRWLGLGGPQLQG
jgi:hypothetical protein